MISAESFYKKVNELMAKGDPTSCQDARERCLKEIRGFARKTSYLYISESDSWDKLAEQLAQNISNGQNYVAVPATWFSDKFDYKNIFQAVRDLAKATGYADCGDYDELELMDHAVSSLREETFKTLHYLGFKAFHVVAGDDGMLITIYEDRRLANV